MNVIGRPRRRTLLWSIACALSLTTAACSTVRVAMPPDSATPEQVVHAYTDAVHAGDCATANALLVNDKGFRWCGSIDITALKVTDSTPGTQVGLSGDGSTITRVWVDLTTHGGDITMQDGPHQWSYLLTRTGPSGAWRIDDQGMG